VKKNATWSLSHSDSERQLSVNNSFSGILGNQGVTQMYEFITALLTALVRLDRIYNWKDNDSK